MSFPNHMGVGGADSPYWLDVLENGRTSRYADWFDIDGVPPDPSLHGKLLVPFLASSYGEAIDAGDIVVRFDDQLGQFSAWANEAHRLPLSPDSYAPILRSAEFDLASTTKDASYHLGLKQKLASAFSASSAVRRRIQSAVDQINSDRHALHDLLARQNWRLAKASVATDDINYRRFFIVSDLAGIRIEDEVVFDHAHRLVFGLIAEGLVDGLRIDHVDGLADPTGYCLALRQKSPRPIYLIVEKFWHRTNSCEWIGR